MNMKKQFELRYRNGMLVGSYWHYENLVKTLISNGLQCNPQRLYLDLQREKRVQLGHYIIIAL